MKTQFLYGAAAMAGLSLLVGPARIFETVQAHDRDDEPVTPIVFQAAGPSVASIQGTVDAFRAALGAPNNGNAPGPLAAGRREINWDGGGSTATSLGPTPFDVFLVTRGSRFITPGSGFVQAPVEGLATTFGNPTYTTIFRAFSPVRLFSPVDSNVTTGRFFVPGGGEVPATTSGFGAIFSDVDRQGDSGDDRGRGEHDNRRSSTSIAFYGADGNLLFKSDVPASPGNAGQSFLGVLFDDARIAYVRIITGNVTPGADDGRRADVVMMDDFLYGEPQRLDDLRAINLLQNLEHR